MFGLNKPDDQNGGAASGMEMMLRSMGLGSVIDAAKTLAESGAVQKILKFADDLEGFNVNETNDRLARIERALNIESEGVQTEPRRLSGPAVEPAPDTGDGATRSVGLP